MVKIVVHSLIITDEMGTVRIIIIFINLNCSNRLEILIMIQHE